MNGTLLSGVSAEASLLPLPIRLATPGALGAWTFPLTSTKRIRRQVTAGTGMAMGPSKMAAKNAARQSTRLDGASRHHVAGAWLLPARLRRSVDPAASPGAATASTASTLTRSTPRSSGPELPPYRTSTVSQDVLFCHREAIAFQTSTLPLTITSNLTATLACAQDIIFEGGHHINKTSSLLSPPPSIGSVANSQAQLSFKVKSLLEMLEAFLPEPTMRLVRGILTIGLSMLRMFGAVGRMIIRLPLSGVARQAAAAAARHAARVSARAFISTGRFLANLTAIKGALLRLGQASMRWLRSPSGKAFLWDTLGATFIHLVTPKQQAESDEELWNPVGSLTGALRETEAYMSDMTITWRNVVEQQQIQALAMEADHIVDKMLLAASASVHHVRSQINSLVEGRFRIDLLSPCEWEALWAELHDTAAKARMTLLACNTADLAHLVPRLERTTDGLLVITVDVPAARKEDVMMLLEYVAVPINE
jgi:hypothetical protein